MNQNLDFALKYIFPNEGGFTNDLNDPGGPTNWGVTVDEWEVFFNKRLTADDVKNATYEDAINVYLNHYWLPVGLDSITDKYKACAIFDQCVNRGISKGTEIAVTAVNMTKNHVSFSPDQIAAINACDRIGFILKFASIARASYLHLLAQPRFAKYAHGWLNRAERLKTLAVL